MLATLDWILIGAFFAVALGIGIVVSRKAGSSSSEFFLSGRHMPWWLLGMSMVATTFSTDTPNLVTDIVRQKGVAGNWEWWAFLLTGMLTVFVYAKLWRRTGVMTDVEFYELRYSGKPATFLRGFRALYLGMFFNIMVMASVSVAAIKLGGVMLNFSPLESILVAAVITVVFSTLGGFRGVLLTDFLLFIIAMAGAVAAAVVALQHPDVGGLSGLLSHENVQGKLSLLPDFSCSTKEGTELLIFIFIIPLTVQWWATWYPGAEPGGGGYIAQRMLAAKNEKHAVGATLFFNAAHYALRPWPWIIVALCSLVVFPELKDLADKFPDIPEDKLKNDLAYPAMLTFLPTGVLGLMVASLIAAYMSTISTHLNWGSSYVVNDFYKRFIKPEANEKELVLVGRMSTAIMMILAGCLALVFQNAFQAFKILLQVGAGTGLLFLLRWFWWRINAFSEITAMVVSFLVALSFAVSYAPNWSVLDLANEWRFAITSGRTALSLYWGQLATGWQFIIGVAVTTASWIAVTYITRPTDENRLRSFYTLARPGGPLWRPVIERARKDNVILEEKPGEWSVPLGLLCMAAGSLAVYAALFATGFFLYGNTTPGLVLTITAVFSTGFLIKTWKRVS